MNVNAPYTLGRKYDLHVMGVGTRPLKVGAVGDREILDQIGRRSCMTSCD